jgi:hypothetical protein
MKRTRDSIARSTLAAVTLAALGTVSVLGTMHDYGFTGAGLMAAGKLFIAGALLFAIAHRVVSGDSTSDPKWRRAGRCAVVIGCALLYVLIAAALNPMLRL